MKKYTSEQVREFISQIDKVHYIDQSIGKDLDIENISEQNDNLIDEIETGVDGETYVCSDLAESEVINSIESGVYYVKSSFLDKKGFESKEDLKEHKIITPAFYLQHEDYLLKIVVGGLITCDAYDLSKDPKTPINIINKSHYWVSEVVGEFEETVQDSLDIEYHDEEYFDHEFGTETYGAYETGTLYLTTYINLINPLEENLSAFLDSDYAQKAVKSAKIKDLDLTKLTPENTRIFFDNKELYVNDNVKDHPLWTGILNFSKNRLNHESIKKCVEAKNQLLQNVETIGVIEKEKRTEAIDKILSNIENMSVELNANDKAYLDQSINQVLTKEKEEVSKAFV